MIEREILLDMDSIIDSVITRIDEGCAVTLTGCGSSMEPYINADTDKLVLEKAAEGKKIRTGEIYLYRRNNGRYAIHRVYKNNGDTLCMLGDAQVTRENFIPRENLVAAVTRIIKPGRTVDCLACSQLVYHTLRMKLRQLRCRVRYICKRLMRRHK